MKILIISEMHDYHAAAVSWGLHQLGCESILWDSGSFPNSFNCSLEIGSDISKKLYLSTCKEIYSDSDIDVVWNRRRGQPKPMKSSNIADHKIIKRESVTFIKNMYAMLSDDRIKWVNPLIDAQLGFDKWTQLVAAKEVNFSIPNTIMSNDPIKVKNFLEVNTDVVFKAFLPGGWVQPNGNQNILKTARVSVEDLNNPIIIKSCPGIFQKYVKKKYDIRVTVIGKTVIAAKIDSQLQGEVVDWRYDCACDSKSISLIQLPDDITSKCLKVCNKLGLVFACIDLVLSDKDEYIFLEVNEAGQFLWKEQSNPDFKLLHIFCNYLAYGDKAVNDQHSDITMKNFAQSDESKKFIMMCKSLEIEDNELFIFE